MRIVDAFGSHLSRVIISEENGSKESHLRSARVEQTLSNQGCAESAVNQAIRLQMWKEVYTVVKLDSTKVSWLKQFMSEGNVLDLAICTKGFLGLDEERGRSHYQAATVCLARQGHLPGVRCTMRKLNEETEDVFLQWTGEVDQQIKNTWEDEDQATEWGAEGIAVVVIVKYTKYTIWRRARSRSKLGFDYWLAEKSKELELTDDDFENVLIQCARLEVSGILEANEGNTVKNRVDRKVTQTKQSDDYGIPAYVIVVEFGTPFIYFLKRSPHL